MLLREEGGGFSLTRLSRLGAAAVVAALGTGETSCCADDIVFGPDMNATGTIVGRTYLGVPRMIPIAGTNRSLGKLLRRELSNLYGDSWWDPLAHPWVFCSFDKTMTALWHAASPPPIERHAASGGYLVRYRWKDIMPRELEHYHGVESHRDPRFYVTMTRPSAPAVLAALSKRLHRVPGYFVERNLGFAGAKRALLGSDRTVTLDAIALRAMEAREVSKRLRADADTALATAAAMRGERAVAIDAEARATALTHLGLLVQLWSDEMLDLAFWMQRNPTVRDRQYTDDVDVARCSTFLLYPHGRRFVSMHGTPDLVPWLPYTSACQEKRYWHPPGGAGGMSVSKVHTTTGGGAAGRRQGTSTTTTGTTAAAYRGMAELAHMVLTKSNPQPCTLRNLGEVIERNTKEDPPVCLATMDAVHIMLMGNYAGCRERPEFAERMQIRVDSLVFRGATASEISNWTRDHYRLLRLALKVWYVETVDQSPAFKAFICDVQHHKEYVGLTCDASDEVRSVVGTMLRCGNRTGKSISRVLNDAAHMSHGASLWTFGKRRKGSFVDLMCNRMRSWLRGCGRDKHMPQQYREEIAQMVVLSKIAYSQPEYAEHVIMEIEQRRRSERSEPGEWALGVPLATLPTAVIKSFLKWDGDSTMTTSPWFADRSFFLSEPYRWIDKDTLRAIDLAAWMCARRVDGRYVMSWLRYPIGLSAETYQRLVNLYFSYECCDVADNTFFVQLRRTLFRRRLRIVPAAEYDSRMARADPMIVHAHTEVIKRVEFTEAGQSRLVPVAYRILEEYGTKESRRDFAIIYEYTNRIAAYRTWSDIPLPRQVMEHQIEALKRRQTLEPWRRTDVEMLGARHLCVCGRWACEVVTPPMRSVTTSVTERRTAGDTGIDRQPTGHAPTVGAEETSGSANAASAASAANSAGINIVPTRRMPSQSMESKVGHNQQHQHQQRAGSPSVRGHEGSVACLDAIDLRTIVDSKRWKHIDRIARGSDVLMDEGVVAAKVVTTVHSPVLTEMAEPITRDVHPSARSRFIGETRVSHDLERPDKGLVSREGALGAPFCANQRMFRVNLIGRAVRPKGPKAPTDGPWYTICATCGCVTTVDLGRWDHRGPSCGAHGRPHRLPDRLAPYDPAIEGAAILDWLRERWDGDTLPIEVPYPKVADKVRKDLARINSDGGFPCPDDVPCCWYCHRPSDHSPSAIPNLSGFEPEPPAQYGPLSYDPTVRVRYEAGTSVATAIVGSTGAALYARNITVVGTHQARPVRRMNLRGSVFGDIVIDTEPGASPIYRPKCQSPIECSVLPTQLIPTAGEEMALKVFDDVYRGDGRIMRLRWLYLCPLHMKELRTGWKSHGRHVQIEKQQQAAPGGSGSLSSSMADRIVMDNAAAGKRIGTQAIVANLFDNVHLLSSINAAIKRGHGKLMRNGIRFNRACDMPLCPDYAESKRRRSQQNG